NSGVQGAPCPHLPVKQEPTALVAPTGCTGPDTIGNPVGGRVATGGCASAVVAANRHAAADRNIDLTAWLLRGFDPWTSQSASPRPPLLYRLHSGSELQHRPDAEPLHGSAVGAPRQHALPVDVVQLKLDVRVPVPVDADGVFAVAAADQVIVV